MSDHQKAVAAAKAAAAEHQLRADVLRGRAPAKKGKKAAKSKKG